MENESGPYSKPDIHPGAPIRVPECHSMMDSVCQPKGITATFESCLQNSTSFCDGGGDSTERHCNDKLESYSNSPQQFRKFVQSTRSPDILSSKVCVELDLVASVPSKLQAEDSPKMRSRRPEDAIAKMLETERTRPDGHESKIASVRLADEVPPPPPPPSADKLDGMLDRICQDLDFLLDRGGGDLELEESVKTSSLRRISKPPSLSVIHQIKEEEESDATVNSPATVIDLKEATITDILRTEC